MSDEAPVLNIQRVYLKDLSLELPNAPQIFLEQAAPNVEVSLDVSPNTLAENIHEVTVMATVTTKVGDKLAFLAEAKQAGIFEIRHIPDEQMPLVLNVVCANITYPYLRATLADVITRSGFPPIHLAEINFEALYQQKLASQGNGQENSGLILPPGVTKQ
jgi:preprotein translocase subunit SecB